VQISTGFASWQRYCMASSSGRQPNFAALNRGRHLCSSGQPSRWALANILVSTAVPVLYIILQHLNNTCYYLKTSTQTYMSTWPTDGFDEWQYMVCMRVLHSHTLYQPYARGTSLGGRTQRQTKTVEIAAIAKPGHLNQWHQNTKG